MGGEHGGATRQTHHHTAGHQRSVGEARHPRNRTSVARRPTCTHLDTPDVLPKDAVAYTGATQRPGPIEHTKWTTTNTNRPPSQFDGFATDYNRAGHTLHSRQYATTPPPLYSPPCLAPHKTTASPPSDPHRIPPLLPQYAQVEDDAAAANGLEGRVGLAQHGRNG